MLGWRHWPSALKHGLLALGLAAVITAAIPAFAQYDSVTLQVTDADGQGWNNGTWQLNGLVPPPGVGTQNYYILGTASQVPNQSQSGSLSASGGATFTVVQNGQIGPPGTVWSLMVCAETGPVVCQASAFTATGSTQTLTVTPAAIRINMSGPPVRVLAYQDLELQNAPLGAQYFNVTSGAWRYCTVLICSSGSGWAYISTGSGGSVNVNGSGVLSPNFNATIPAASSNGINVTWQVSGSSVSAEVVGNGTATQYLNGTGAWSTPSGGGNVSNSGTPTGGQIAQWVTSTSIEGNTMGGDCTINSSGAITCTKTSGTAFGTFATIAAGTLTNGDVCTYSSTGPTIACNTSPTGALPSGTKGQALVNTTGSTSYATSPVVPLDASQFTSGSIGSCTLGTNDDICIRNAIAAAPTTAEIDISNLGSSGALKLGSNPFADLIGSGFTSAQKCITLIAHGPLVITTNMPIVMPTCSKIINDPPGEISNGLGVLWIAGSSFPTPYTTGTVTNTTSSCNGSLCQMTVTGSGTSFTSSMLYSHIAVCASSASLGSYGLLCGSSGGNNAWGLIVAVNSSTSLTVDTITTGIAANSVGANYVIWAPTVTEGDVNSSGTNMRVQWVGGAISTGGYAPVAAANYNSQETTYFKDTQLQCPGTGTFQCFHIDGNAFNSGPYENVSIDGVGNCNANSIMMIVRSTISAAFPRDMRSSSISSTNCNSGAGLNTVIDWEANGELSHIHIENGTGSGTQVSLSGAVTCPIICIRGTNGVQNAKINYIDSTVIGSSGTLVTVGTNSPTKNYEISHLAANGGTILNDTKTGCSIAYSSEPQLVDYQVDANSVIVHSSSRVSGCLAAITATTGSFTGAVTTNNSTNVCGSMTSCLGGVESSPTLAPASGDDFLQYNSTTHAVELSNNDSTFEPIPALNGSFTAGHALKVNAQLGGGSAYDIADAGYPSNAIPAADIASGQLGSGVQNSSSLNLTGTVASGTATLGTSSITSGTCASTVTVTASGVATTDVIQYTPSTNPQSSTGYAASASGSLYIWAYPTSGNVNFEVCNNTSSGITPGALTLNWRVVR